MAQSMTGFGSSEAKVAAIGKIRVELRSSNHKFQETILHLPEGLLSLEEKIKNTIESKVKRGRITCVVNIFAKTSPSVYVNRPLLRTYVSTLNSIKRQFGIKDEISINALITLPGVLSLEENRLPKASIWPRLEALVREAVEALVRTRRKEGRALQAHLKKRAGIIKAHLAQVKLRFKKAIKEKLETIGTSEERSSFLKDTDITEEIERLAFHADNFISKFSKPGPMGKELDFMAQEMQREANTMAAKTFDVTISSRVVQIKSQIEKIREQAQNIE